LKRRKGDEALQNRQPKNSLGSELEKGGKKRGMHKKIVKGEKIETRSFKGDTGVYRLDGKRGIPINFN